MKRVLEVVDKIGRTIYLTEERYKHILKHPEMQNCLSSIEEAIKNPQKIAGVSFDSAIKGKVFKGNSQIY